MKKKNIRKWLMAVAAATALSGCQKVESTQESSVTEITVSESAEESKSESIDSQGKSDTLVGTNYLSSDIPITQIPLSSLGVIKLTDYSLVEVTMTQSQEDVSEGDITAYINAQLAKTLQDVTGRGAQKGDTVTVDFLGLVDGKSFSGNKGTDYSILLGTGQMLPDFEDALYGTSAGDDVTVDVKFPDDYNSTEVAGKTAKFTIHIKKIQKSAELNTEFIKNHSKAGAENEEAYRTEVKELIQKLYENVKTVSAISQAIQQIMQNSTLEPSSAYTDYLYRYQEKRFNDYLKSVNISLDEYKKSAGLEEGGVENVISEAVAQSIGQIMVMRQIAADQGLDNPETQKKALIQYTSELYGEEMSEEDLAKAYGNDLDLMELQAVVYEWMKNHVNITWQETSGQ